MNDEEHMTIFHIDIIQRQRRNSQSNIDHLIDGFYHTKVLLDDLSLTPQIHGNHLLGSLAQGAFIQFDVVQKNRFLYSS